MSKAKASSKERHLRIKLPDKHRVVKNKYSPVYGKSKALCEAVGRTRFIYPPKFANPGTIPSMFLHPVSCNECLKELAERRLIPDKEISEFEKRNNMERFDIMVKALENFSKLMGYNI